MADLMSEFLEVATKVEADHPMVASLLRTAAGQAVIPDPRALRRATLLRITWRHERYRGLVRTTAARLLAADWRAWHESGSRVDLPGSVGAEFALLERANVAPVGWRTIADDLDPDL